MTSLIHFTTSINTAQVVVVGSSSGMVSWYISQPPQKTFSLLYNTHCHAPHPVVSLQVRQGALFKKGACRFCFGKHHLEEGVVYSP